MSAKWTVILMILKFSSGVSAAPPVVKQVHEGENVDISCRISEAAPYLVWFRVLDRSGMEYIASVSSVNPSVKTKGPQFTSLFRDPPGSAHTLTLKSFTKADSGAYSCASLGKEIKFGPVTRLEPVKAAEATPPSVKTAATTEGPSTTPCVCPTPPAALGPMQCSVMILAPLAGGCGLLLLVLLCTILYCNSVRTRRCPHHYKRKPRMVAPGKQLMTNAHI